MNNLKEPMNVISPVSITHKKLLRFLLFLLAFHIALMPEYNNELKTYSYKFEERN